MKNANMLYRCPGAECFEGVSCETVIVDEDEVEAMLAEGWSRDWIRAGEVAKDAAAAQLAANEAEQARIAADLKAAGAQPDEAEDLVGDEPAPTVKARSKRG